MDGKHRHLHSKKKLGFSKAKALGSRLRFFSKKNLSIKAGGEISAHELQESAHLRLAAIEKKRTRVRSLILILTVLFVMVLTIGVVKLLLNRSSGEPVLQFLMVDSVHESYEARGVIVRDETLYSAGLTGIIRPLQAEASKVGKQEMVAMVLSPTMKNIYDEWNQLSAAIAKRRLELIAQGQGSGSAMIFQESDTRMGPLLNDLRKMTSRRSAGNVDALKNSIDALIFSRNLKLNKLSFSDANLSDLSARQATLDEQLKNRAAYLYTDSSGYISYMSDGLESILTPETILRIDETQLQDLLSKGESYRPISESVQNIAPAYRLSKSSGQFLLLAIKGLNSGYFKEVKTFSVSLPKENLLIHSCTVLNVKDNDEGCLLLCSTSSQVENLIDRRNIEGRIAIGESTSGYRVPNSVLVDYSSYTRQAKLMIIKDDVSCFVPVLVRAQNERFSVVEDLKGNRYLMEGRLYVENPQDVKEGRPVD